MLKEFLKPNRWKLGLSVVAALLSVIPAVLFYDSLVCPDCYANPSGFPFPFYHPAGIGGIAGAPYPAFLNPITLLLDIAAYYLLGCLIYFVFAKIRENELR